jgi:hypothetical protein
VAVAAVCAENDVVTPQVSTHAGGDSLFTHIRVAGTVDQAPLVGARQLFLAPPDRLHLAVKR